MPYLLIFGETMCVLSGAITDKRVIKLFCCWIKKTSNDQIKFAAKNINANFIACNSPRNNLCSSGVTVIPFSC